MFESVWWFSSSLVVFHKAEGLVSSTLCWDVSSIICLAIWSVKSFLIYYLLIPNQVISVVLTDKPQSCVCVPFSDWQQRKLLPDPPSHQNKSNNASIYSRRSIRHYIIYKHVFFRGELCSCNDKVAWRGFSCQAWKLSPSPWRQLSLMAVIPPMLNTSAWIITIICRTTIGWCFQSESGKVNRVPESHVNLWESELFCSQWPSEPCQFPYGVCVCALYCRGLSDWVVQRNLAKLSVERLS